MGGTCYTNGGYINFWLGGRGGTKWRIATWGYFVNISYKTRFLLLQFLLPPTEIMNEAGRTTPPHFCRPAAVTKKAAFILCLRY